MASQSEPPSASRVTTPGCHRRGCCGDQDGRVNDPRQAVGWVAAALAATAYAWWVVGLPAFSAAASVAVVGAGAMAMVAGGRARRTGRRNGRPGRILPWFALAGLLAAVQLIALAQQPRSEPATLTSLTNAALDSHAARAAALPAWLAPAAELARRAPP